MESLHLLHSNTLLKMIKETRDNVLFYLFQKLYRIGHRTHMNWLYYSIIFGSLPMGLRSVISLSSSSEQIPLFALTDFAFWGIMLNTAAIANATNQKQYSHDLVNGIVSATLTHIVLLTAVYCIALPCFP